MFPSQVSNLPESDYHGHSALGSTDLKLILRSPLHYRHKKETQEDTPALNFGKAFHMAILEPDRFQSDVAVMPKFSGKGSVAERERWALEHQGKLILSESELDDVKQMRARVLFHKAASRLLTKGVAEESFFWEDAETGLKCKARSDYLRTDRIVIDVKTTQDASLSEFQKTILYYKYHLSAAHYLDGISQVTCQQYDTFLIIACEKTAPYAVQVFEIDYPTLEKGRELKAKALKAYKASLSGSEMIGYPEEISLINIPAYGFNN